MVGTGPEREEMVETPGEFVTTVSIDGLEQTQHNPNVHGENVQVTSKSAPEDRATDCTETQNHNFDWRRVFSSQAKGSRVLVVDFVNGLVEGTPVESAVGEVVPGILHDKKDSDLVGHGPGGREGDGCRQTAELGHWVEEPVKIVSTGGAECRI